MYVYLLSFLRLARENFSNVEDFYTHLIYLHIFMGKSYYLYADIRVCIINLSNAIAISYKTIITKLPFPE